MEKVNKLLLVVGTIAITLGLLLFFESRNPEVATQQVLAGTPGNIASQVASSTKIVLAARQKVRAFSTSTPQSRGTCASRIISSYGGPIVITLDDPRENVYRDNIGSTTLSYMVGHQLASSTLHVLDSATYGCGDIYVHAPGTDSGATAASTTVTVTEFR